MRCYVLAGGRSTRMGRPKDQLVLDGKTFLQRVCNAAADVFTEVIIVARGCEQRGVRSRIILDDAYTDRAPALAISRALKDAVERNDERAWILAVDYPLIEAEFLRYLRYEFESSTAELLVPVVAETPQMLCSGYSTSMMPILQQRIEDGDYALRPLIRLCRSWLIDERSMASRFDLRILLNVNTLEELQSLRRIHEQTHAPER